MNLRAAKQIALYVILGLAVIVLLLLILAYAAQDSNVPARGFFTGPTIAEWNTFGVLAFLILAAAAVIIYWRPRDVITVLELSPTKTGPNVHVRCRHCDVVHWVEASGEPPLRHFCPSCGREGVWGEEGGGGDDDFIYTQVEVKLGCRNCNTSFTYPEPLVRPLYVRCPNCKAHGVLGTKARAVDATEEEVVCPSCEFTFHAYEVDGRKVGSLECPNCHNAIDRRGIPSKKAADRRPAPVEAEEAEAEVVDEAAAPGPAGPGRPVIDLEGIGPKYANQLNDLGIRTIEELRAVDGAQTAEKLGIAETVVRNWQAMGELMEVPGIGPQFAELLVRSGVESVEQLRGHKPKALLDAINKTNKGRKVRIQGRGVGPKTVENWIRAARRTNA